MQNFLFLRWRIVAPQRRQFMYWAGRLLGIGYPLELVDPGGWHPIPLLDGLPGDTQPLGEGCQPTYLI